MPRFRQEVPVAIFEKPRLQVKSSSATKCFCNTQNQVFSEGPELGRWYGQLLQLLPATRPQAWSYHVRPKTFGVLPQLS